MSLTKFDSGPTPSPNSRTSHCCPQVLREEDPEQVRRTRKRKRKHRYARSHSSLHFFPRRLGWIYSLGMCHLKGNFDSKPIEMVMSTMQAACLVLFNDTSELSYKEIQQRLNLPDDDVTRLLHRYALTFPVRLCVL